MTKNQGVFALRRSVSLFVLITFVFTNHFVVPGYAANNSLVPEAGSAGGFPSNSAEIKIPQEFGKIQESFQGKGSETLVLIQDAHAIPDAQRSIQQLIGYFRKQYGLNLVTVEGAASELDPQFFKSFPDQERLQKTLDQYLEKGELTGSTAAAILSAKNSAGTETHFYGIEDWNLYEEGLGLYLKAVKQDEEIFKKIDASKAQLQKQKESVYSKELLSLDKTLENFHANHSCLNEVLMQLAALKAPEKGTELALLVEETRREKENKTPIETEVKNLAEQVFLSLRSSAPIKAEAISEFNAKTQAFQTSSLAPEAFALYLKETAAKYNIPVQISGHLERLLNNQKQMRDIEGTRFFKDFEAYAAAVKELLLTTDAQRALERESHELGLIERLARLELSREDWKEVRKVEGGRSKVEGKAENDALSELLEAHIYFYQNAEKRENAFLKNMTVLMKKHQTNSSLLVAGGFHTGGLTQKLKEQGISYVLVMPKINTLPETTHYRELMNGSVSWKDYFEVENGRVDLAKAFIRGTRDQLLEDSRESSVLSREEKQSNNSRLTPHDSRLLKGWRDQIIRDLAQNGKITQVGQYTTFIDEVSAKNQRGLRPEWQIKAENFIKGLRKLEAQGKLTQQNVMRLLQPATMTNAAGGNTSLALGSTLPAAYLPAAASAAPFAMAMSEMRAVPEVSVTENAGRYGVTIGEQKFEAENRKALIQKIEALFGLKSVSQDDDYLAFDMSAYPAYEAKYHSKQAYSGFAVERVRGLLEVILEFVPLSSAQMESSVVAVDLTNTIATPVIKSMMRGMPQIEMREDAYSTSWVGQQGVLTRMADKHIIYKNDSRPQGAFDLYPESIVSFSAYQLTEPAGQKLRFLISVDQNTKLSFWGDLQNLRTQKQVVVDAGEFEIVIKLVERPAAKPTAAQAAPKVAQLQVNLTDDNDVYAVFGPVINRLLDPALSAEEAAKINTAENVARLYQAATNGSVKTSGGLDGAFFSGLIISIAGAAQRQNVPVPTPLVHFLELLGNIPNLKERFAIANIDLLIDQMKNAAPGVAKTVSSTAVPANAVDLTVFFDPKQTAKALTAAARELPERSSRFRIEDLTMIGGPLWIFLNDQQSGGYQQVRTPFDVMGRRGPLVVSWAHGGRGMFGLGFGGGRAADLFESLSADTSISIHQLNKGEEDEGLEIGVEFDGGGFGFGMRGIGGEHLFAEETALQSVKVVPADGGKKREIYITLKQIPVEFREGFEELRQALLKSKVKLQMTESGIMLESETRKFVILAETPAVLVNPETLNATVRRLSQDLNDSPVHAHLEAAIELLEAKPLVQSSEGGERRRSKSESLRVYGLMALIPLMGLDDKLAQEVLAEAGQLNQQQKNQFISAWIEYEKVSSGQIKLALAMASAKSQKDLREQINVRLVQKLAEEKDFTAALAGAEELHSANQPKALMDIAQKQSEAGQSDGAGKTFDEVKRLAEINANPESRIGMLSEIGRLQAALGLISQARATFSAIVPMITEDARLAQSQSVRRVVINAMAQAKLYQDALLTLGALLPGKTKDDEAVKSILDAAVEEGNFQEAEKLLEQFQKQHSRSSGHEAIARGKVLRGDDSAAKTILSSKANQNQKDSILQSMAIQQAQSGLRDKPIKTAGMIKHPFIRFETYRLLAIELAKKGFLDKALALIEKHWSDIDAAFEDYSAIARIFAEQEKIEDAKKVLQTAAALAAKTQSHQAKVAQVQAELGLYSEVWKQPALVKLKTDTSDWVIRLLRGIANATAQGVQAGLAKSNDSLVSYFSTLQPIEPPVPADASAASVPAETASIDLTALIAMDFKSAKQTLQQIFGDSAQIEQTEIISEPIMYSVKAKLDSNRGPFVIQLIGDPVRHLSHTPTMRIVSQESGHALIIAPDFFGYSTPAMEFRISETSIKLDYTPATASTGPKFNVVVAANKWEELRQQVERSFRGNASSPAIQISEDMIAIHNKEFEVVFSRVVAPQTTTPVVDSAFSSPLESSAKTIDFSSLTAGGKWDELQRVLTADMGFSSFATTNDKGDMPQQERTADEVLLLKGLRGNVTFIRGKGMSYQSNVIREDNGFFLSADSIVGTNLYVPTEPSGAKRILNISVDQNADVSFVGAIQNLSTSKQVVIDAGEFDIIVNLVERPAAVALPTAVDVTSFFYGTRRDGHESVSSDASGQLEKFVNSTPGAGMQQIAGDHEHGYFNNHNGHFEYIPIGRTSADNGFFSLNLGNIQSILYHDGAKPRFEVLIEKGKVKLSGALRSLAGPEAANSKQFDLGNVIVEFRLVEPAAAAAQVAAVPQAAGSPVVSSSFVGHPVDSVVDLKNILISERGVRSDIDTDIANTGKPWRNVLALERDGSNWSWKIRGNFQVFSMVGTELTFTGKIGSENFTLPLTSIQSMTYYDGEKPRIEFLIEKGKAALTGALRLSGLGFPESPDSKQFDLGNVIVEFRLVEPAAAPTQAAPQAQSPAASEPVPVSSVRAATDAPTVLYAVTRRGNTAFIVKGDGTVQKVELNVDIPSTVRDVSIVRGADGEDHLYFAVGSAGILKDQTSVGPKLSNAYDVVGKPVAGPDGRVYFSVRKTRDSLAFVYRNDQVIWSSVDDFNGMKIENIGDPVIGADGKVYFTVKTTDGKTTIVGDKTSVWVGDRKEDVKSLTVAPDGQLFFVSVDASIFPTPVKLRNQTGAVIAKATMTRSLSDRDENPLRIVVHEGHVYYFMPEGEDRWVLYRDSQKIAKLADGFDPVGKPVVSTDGSVYFRASNFSSLKSSVSRILPNESVVMHTEEDVSLQDFDQLHQITKPDGAKSLAYFTQRQGNIVYVEIDQAGKIVETNMNVPKGSTVLTVNVLPEAPAKTAGATPASKTIVPSVTVPVNAVDVTEFLKLGQPRKVLSEAARQLSNKDSRFQVRIDDFGPIVIFLKDEKREWFSLSGGETFPLLWNMPDENFGRSVLADRLSKEATIFFVAHDDKKIGKGLEIGLAVGRGGWKEPPYFAEGAEVQSINVVQADNKNNARREIYITLKKIPAEFIEGFESIRQDLSESNVKLSIDASSIVLESATRKFVILAETPAAVAAPETLNATVRSMINDLTDSPARAHLEAALELLEAKPIPAQFQEGWGHPKTESLRVYGLMALIPLLGLDEKFTREVLADVGLLNQEQKIQFITEWIKQDKISLEQIRLALSLVSEISKKEKNLREQVLVRFVQRLAEEKDFVAALVEADKLGTSDKHQAFMDIAQKQSEDGKAEEAGITLGKAKQLAERGTNVRWKISALSVVGKKQSKLGFVAEAKETFNDVLRLAIQNNEFEDTVRRPIVWAMADAQLYPEAIMATGLLTKREQKLYGREDDDGPDVEALKYVAGKLAKEGRTAEAMDVVHLMKNDWYKALSYSDIAHALIQRGEYDAVEKILSDGSNEKFAQLKDAILKNMAVHQAGNNLTVNALQTVKRIADLEIQTAAYNQLIVAVAKQNSKAALALIPKHLKKDADKIKAHIAIAKILAEQGKIEDVKKLLQDAIGIASVISANYERVDALAAIARTQAELGLYSEIWKQAELEKIRNSSSDRDADLLRNIAKATFQGVHAGLTKFKDQMAEYLKTPRQDAAEELEVGSSKLEGERPEMKGEDDQGVATIASDTSVSITAPGYETDVQVVDVGQGQDTVPQVALAGNDLEPLPTMTQIDTSFVGGIDTEVVQTTAVQLVNLFQGNIGQTDLDLPEVATTIVTAGAAEFVEAFETVVAMAVRKADVQLGIDVEGYRAAILAIDRPVVIEYQISQADLQRMGKNAEPVIANLVQAAHDAAAVNKNIISRILVLESAAEFLQIKDHSKRDRVQTQIMKNVMTVYHSELENSEAQIQAPATMTVADSIEEGGSFLLSDKYGDQQGIQYPGPEGAEVAARIFTAALVWTAESLSERTFAGLVSAEGAQDLFRVASRDALNAMGSLIGIMAQMRSELRIQQAA